MRCVRIAFDLLYVLYWISDLTCASIGMAADHFPDVMSKHLKDYFDREGVEIASLSDASRQATLAISTDPETSSEEGGVSGILLEGQDLRRSSYV